MFHLAWFMNGYTPLAWKHPWAGNLATEWMKPDLWVDLTESLERGGFDYLLIEDTSMVHDAYGKSTEVYLKHAIHVPKNDPLPLVPYLAQATKHIGIVPTISSTLYPPFLAARLMATLDHLTEGRVGINVVTSVSDRAAQNFGMDSLTEHDLRYEMAHEWMDVVTQLWESWEPDAVLADTERGIYADHTKVHEIDFHGRFHKVRGPLNTVPGPQRRPVVAQAGGSPAGRAFAAAYADTILASVPTVEGMKEYRQDMDARLIANGRKPSDCKVLFIVTPIVANSDADARAEDAANRARAWEPVEMEERLAHMSYQGGTIDFAAYDLDGPFPQELGTGERSVMANYLKISEGKTLREIAAWRPGEELGFIGSPDTVAARMGEVMEEVGGDGFLFSNAITRRTVTQITEGLCPALRKRGLIRPEYTHEHFRDNLLEF